MASARSFSCPLRSGSVVYRSERRDPHGVGVQLFRRHYEEKVESKRKKDPGEIHQVLYNVKRKLTKANQVLSQEAPDVERAVSPERPQNSEEIRKALAELYAALHYERPVRIWAAESRRFFPEEGRPKDDDKDATHKTSRRLKLWYWLWPVLMFMCCFVLQSFLLHIATREYILYVDTAKQVLRKRGGVLNQTFAHEQGMEDKHFDFTLNGTLPDMVTNNLSHHAIKIPLWLLDLTGAGPGALFILTFVIVAGRLGGTRNIGLWTKTFAIASIMSILKGVCDVVTIIPDSVGWHGCVERLGDENVEAFRHLIFRRNFVRAFLRTVMYEISGGPRGRIRYCADMLVSGHTYFAVLFALSGCEMVMFLTNELPQPRRFFTRALVQLSCVFCVVTEVVLVACAKFHYTVDMLLSLVLVLILWDSTHIEGWARRMSAGYAWKHRRPGDWWRACCRYASCRCDGEIKVRVFRKQEGRDWKKDLFAWLVKNRERRHFVRVLTNRGHDLGFRWHDEWPADKDQRNPNAVWYENMEFFILGGDKGLQKLEAKKEGRFFPLHVFEVPEIESWKSGKLIDLRCLYEELLENPWEFRDEDLDRDCCGCHCPYPCPAPGWILDSACKCFSSEDSDSDSEGSSSQEGQALLPYSRQMG